MLLEITIPKKQILQAQQKNKILPNRSIVDDHTITIDYPTGWTGDPSTSITKAIEIFGAELVWKYFESTLQSKVKAEARKQWLLKGLSDEVQDVMWDGNGKQWKPTLQNKFIDKVRGEIASLSPDQKRAKIEELQQLLKED